MRHNDQRPVSGFGEPGGDPAGEDLIGFAVRRREIPLVRTLAVEGPRLQRGDLGAAEPLPGAERELAQTIIEAQGLDAAERFSDDLGAVAGPPPSGPPPNRRPPPSPAPTQNPPPP